MNLNDRGSITVEAALVFPLFLAVILLLVNMIHVAMVQTAMDHAVDEAVKQIAAYSFPLGDIRTGVGEIQQLADDAETAMEDLPFLTGAGDLLRAYQEYIETGAAHLLEEAIKGFAEKEIQEKFPVPGFSWEMGMRMTAFKVCNLFAIDFQTDQNQIATGDQDIMIAIEYQVPIKIPFCPIKEVTLVSAARERAWMD